MKTEGKKSSHEVLPFKSRKNLQGKTRLRILSRDGHSCRYCGTAGEDWEMVVDHVIAVARGGSNEDANLVTSCLRCNALKWAHPAGFMIEQAPEHLREWWREFLTNPPETPKSDEISPKAFTDVELQNIREYMRQLGSKSTPRKAASSRENAKRAAAARLKDPLTLPCICAGGDSLKVKDHVTTCPRGRLLWQRARKAAQGSK